MLSVLVSKNIDAEKITKSLKYKNGTGLSEAKENIHKFSKEKDTSLVLDDISMIQPCPRA